MKKLLIILFLFVSPLTFSQEKDYFIVDGVKTYCEELNFETNAKSYLKSIIYNDSNGKEILI